jgi:hypothetical protein
LITNLATSHQTRKQVQGTLFLDFVIRKSATILELISQEYQSLLVRGVPCLVLDFGLNFLNRVARFNVKSMRISSKSFDKDLKEVWIEVEGIFGPNRFIQSSKGEELGAGGSFLTLGASYDILLRRAVRVVLENHPTTHIKTELGIHPRIQDHLVPDRIDQGRRR